MERHHYYFVMWDEAGWIVQSEGENSQPFATRLDAVRGAIGLAHLDHKRGGSSRVIAQGEDGVFRAAWISDLDTYPPRAAVAIPPNTRRPRDHRQAA